MMSSVWPPVAAGYSSCPWTVIGGVGAASHRTAFVVLLTRLLALMLGLILVIQIATTLVRNGWLRLLHARIQRHVLATAIDTPRLHHAVHRTRCRGGARVAIWRTVVRRPIRRGTSTSTGCGASGSILVGRGRDAVLRDVRGKWRDTRVRVRVRTAARAVVVVFGLLMVVIRFLVTGRMLAETVVRLDVTRLAFPGARRRCHL